MASSENLPVRRGVIDFVLSSPPYCTRIDYGVATSAELAVLGYPVDTRLRELRGRLIGTPTIHAETPDPTASWGEIGGRAPEGCQFPAGSCRAARFLTSAAVVLSGAYSEAASPIRA